jgi:hypothetical protein
MTKIFTKRFIMCPGCDQHAHEIEHLFGTVPKAFGPWACSTDDCLIKVSGMAHPGAADDMPLHCHDCWTEMHSTATVLDGAGLGDEQEIQRRLQ